jgi:hypothetical protein
MVSVPKLPEFLACRGRPVCWGRRAGAVSIAVRPVRAAGRAGRAGLLPGASRIDVPPNRLQPVRWNIDPVAGRLEMTG